MTELRQDQQAMQAAIRKKAMIWGIVLAVIVGAILWWALGSQGGLIRAGGALLGGGATGFATLRKTMSSGAASARCGSCNAAYSISRSARHEDVTASEDKETREAQEDGSTNVTTWVEDSIDVRETYTCATCGDITTKEFQTTKRRDEEKSVVPKPEPKKGGKSDKVRPASDKSSDSARKGGAKGGDKKK